MAQEAGLKQKITGDIKQAMKGGDKLKLATLRMLMSSINNAEKAKQAVLEDSDILGVIAKEVKRHQESIEAFKQGKRQDLVDKEEAEMAVLQGYLPQQMTREEIVKAAQEVIGEVGAQGPADKGRVMKELMPRLKGRADGKEINEVVTELLSK
jgi:uncharacterized protein YqeY